MKPIHYPCETAVIFDDIVYPIYLSGPHQIEQEVSGAINWFSRWCNEEKMVVKANLLVSFNGAYLNYKQVMEVA